MRHVCAWICLFVICGHTWSGVTLTYERRKYVDTHTPKYLYRTCVDAVYGSGDIEAYDTRISRLNAQGRKTIKRSEINTIDGAGLLSLYDTHVSRVEGSGDMEMQRSRVSLVSLYGDVSTQSSAIDTVKARGDLSCTDSTIGTISSIGELIAKRTSIQAYQITGHVTCRDCSHAQESTVHNASVTMIRSVAPALCWILPGSSNVCGNGKELLHSLSTHTTSSSPDLDVRHIPGGDMHADTTSCSVTHTMRLVESAIDAVHIYNDTGDKVSVRILSPQKKIGVYFARGRGDVRTDAPSYVSINRGKVRDVSSKSIDV